MPGTTTRFSVALGEKFRLPRSVVECIVARGEPSCDGAQPPASRANHRGDEASFHCSGQAFPVEVHSLQAGQCGFAPRYRRRLLAWGGHEIRTPRIMLLGMKKTGKEEDTMKGPITTGMSVPAVKRVKHGLAWLCLLMLLGLGGAATIHVSLAGAPAGRQLAPAPGGSGGSDSGPTSVRITAPAGALTLYPAPGGGGGGDPVPTRVD